MNKLPEKTRSDSAILFYQTEDGRSRIEVRLENNTVWLPQSLLAELFRTTVPNISMHIRNILEEGELWEDSVVKEFLTTAADGKRYSVSFYNLDMIIAIGYRVRSIRGTQFRQWATARLKEYIVKGFALDDERLKNPPGLGTPTYFDELLARIRDIRSSEKIFWRKILDIYATSMDYDPSVEASRKLFAVVQNKMHWAAHGHTAAEIVHDRADAAKPHMGLTSWCGVRPRSDEVEIAKNYLTAEELDALNRIVTAYLEFAELQALNRTPMYMRDWIAKLDDFLKLSGRELLEHAGAVSHEKALEKARAEYEKYRAAHLNDPAPVEQHFLEAAKQVEQRVKSLAERNPKRAPARRRAKKGRKS